MWKVQKQSVIPYCIFTFNCYSHRTYCWLVPIQNVTSNCVILGFRGLSRVELKYGKFWGHLIMLVCFMINKNEWLHSICSVARFVAVHYDRLFESGDLNSYLCFGDACFISRLEQLILSFFMIFIFFQGNCFLPSSHFVFWLCHTTHGFPLNRYTFLCNHVNAHLWHMLKWRLCSSNSKCLHSSVYP